MPRRYLVGSSSSVDSDFLERGEEALIRVNKLKTFLIMSKELDAQDHGKWYFLTKEARAVSIVGGMAELEALTKEFLKQVNQEINNTGYPVSLLKPCVRALAGHAYFDSLRDTSDATTVWGKRALVTTFELSTDPTVLPLPTKGPQPPLDGKTLTPAHFQRIWDVYGIPGTPFPELRWGQTLQKLAGLRNDIAHGNLPFDEIFRSPGISNADVERYLEELELLIIFLVSEWDDYSSRKLFLQGT